jgi:hypothetical protein
MNACIAVLKGKKKELREHVQMLRIILGAYGT